MPATGQGQPDTYAGIVSHFVSFLTVAIHTILYERKIYPKESFLTARAYNFPVRQSRHPSVCAWINDAVDAVQVQLLQGHVDKLSVVIIHPKTYASLERFVFDLSRLMTVAPEDANTTFSREFNGQSAEAKGSGEKSGHTQTEWVDLDEQLRAAMSKLSTCGSLLKPIPEGCTFTVAVELKEDGKPPLSHPQAWMPVEPASQRSVLQGQDIEELDTSKSVTRLRTKEGDDVRGAHTVPLRSIEAGELMFELWVEEGRAKADTPVVSQSFGTDTTSLAS